MASLSNLVVLFAILILPSRVFSQVRETTAPPALTSAVPACEPGAGVELVRPCSAVLCFPCDDPACSRPRQSVFIFGGAYMSGSMGDTAKIFDAPDYDGNVVIGLGYQRYHWSWRHFDLGWEVGLAGRFGDDQTGEVWGGATIRYDAIVLARRLRITPSFTAGLSAVTETMAVEREREVSHEGDGSLLFYLGPEIGLSTTARPNIELFYRLHHRSGCGFALGGMMEGYNSNVIGLRFRF